MPISITLGGCPAHQLTELPVTTNAELRAAYQQMYRTIGDLKTMVCDYRRSMKEISRAHHETLVRLALAAEYKDGGSGIHLIRIGQIAARIGQELNLDREYLARICRAAPMHDVGKIGIPDSILSKAGQLDDAEWSIMRQHPIIGARLLGDSDMPLFQMARSIALNHHEKWDGSGYPNQLAGLAIPLEARITALAEYFDALTMNRCFRGAIDDHAVLAMIVEESGSHFDPAIVDAFIAAAPEIIRLRNAINFRFGGEQEMKLDIDRFELMF